MIYEEFSLDFTKKALVDSQTNLNNQKSNKSGLPNLNLTGLSIMSENQSIKQNSNEDSSDYFNLDTGFMKKMSKQKTMIDNMRYASLVINSVNHFTNFFSQVKMLKILSPKARALIDQSH